MTLSLGSEYDVTTFTVLAIGIFLNHYSSTTQYKLIRKGSLIKWHTKTQGLVIHSPLTQRMSLKAFLKHKLNS